MNKERKGRNDKRKEFEERGREGNKERYMKKKVEEKRRKKKREGNLAMVLVEWSWSGKCT